MTQGSTSPKTAPASPEGKSGSHQYVNFLFLKVDPSFYGLLSNEKLVARQEFINLMDKYHEDTILVPYSLVGLRAEVDLLFWRISPKLETLQDMSGRMRAVGLGKYLRPVYSFLTMARPPIYARAGKSPPPPGKLVPGQMRYLFVYPFSKTREWFQLPEEERKEIMREHLRVSDQFRGVQRNSTYLYGLDDHDFVSAYESNEPESFVALLNELRGTRASRYTPRATPIFTCVRKDLADLIESFG